MKRLVEQQERSQIILFPKRLDDHVEEDNPLRVVDVFVEGLYLAALGFEGAIQQRLGVLLIILLSHFNYTSMVSSTASRCPRLERAAQC